MTWNIRHFIDIKTKEAFYKFGYFIGEYPWINLAWILLLCLVMSTGLLWFREANNVRYDFTSTSSTALYEYKVLQEFYQDEGEMFYLIITVRARDNGNLLRINYIDDIMAMEDQLRNCLVVRKGGEPLSYSILCGTNCESNNAVNHFLGTYKAIQQQANVTSTKHIKLSYPVMEIFGTETYMGNYLFDVQQDQQGTITSVKTIILQYRTNHNNEATKQLLGMWERAVLQEITSHRWSSLDMTVYSEGLISNEIRRTGMTAVPYLFVTLAVILAITVFTSLRIDPSRSKPWEAFGGVVNPLLALCSAFGLLFWLGQPFKPIITVTPFLVLAVGVDDVFLCLHAWHKTDPTESVPQRLGKCLERTGPSIAITSLTNTLSFTIGAFSPTPAVAAFCTFSAVSIAIEYVFQMVLFSSILALGGRREERKQNAYCFHDKKIELKNQEKHTLAVGQLYEKLLDKWAHIAMKWATRTVVLALLLIYWLTAIYGCLQMESQLSINKLFLKDSAMHDFIKVQKETQFKDGGQLWVFVNNPGDLRNRSAMETNFKLVQEVENAENSQGPISTSYWLRDYNQFIHDFHSESDFTYEYLPHFLQTTTYSKWKEYIQYDDRKCVTDQGNCVRKYVFSTGFANATDYTYRLKLLINWRNILSQYPELNATAFEVLAMFADQIQTIGPVTRNNMIIAIICMALICFALIPNALSVLCATLSVISINIGVLGYLMLWNVQLDPISMASILMSVGFSVDFTAHASYHMFRNENETPQERIRSTLNAVAWPSLQAGSSTVLSVLILCVIDAYMITVFVKSVFLVVTLGLVHGVLFLPVILAALPCSFEAMCWEKEKNEQT